MRGRCSKGYLKVATFDNFGLKMINFAKSSREGHQSDLDEQDGKSLVFWRALDRHITQRA